MLSSVVFLVLFIISVKVSREYVGRTLNSKPQWSWGGALGFDTKDHTNWSPSITTSSVGKDPDQYLGVLVKISTAWTSPTLIPSHPLLSQRTWESRNLVRMQNDRQNWQPSKKHLEYEPSTPHALPVGTGEVKRKPLLVFWIPRMHSKQTAMVEFAHHKSFQGHPH